MKLNKFLIPTCLVPIAVIPAIVSCNKQNTKTEYELIYDKDIDCYKPVECLISQESVTTIDLLPGVNYTFSANTTNDHLVQGFFFGASDGYTRISFEDSYTKLVVKQNGELIEGELRDGNTWFFNKTGTEIYGKIEVSITLIKPISCVPIISRDL